MDEMDEVKLWSSADVFLPMEKCGSFPACGKYLKGFQTLLFNLLMGVVYCWVQGAPTKLAVAKL